MNLTPQEALQAIADGKKLEYKWNDRDEWCELDPLNNGIVIEHIFKENFIFRLAPAMITVGDVSFPKPESKPLKYDTEYWVAEPSHKNYTTLGSSRWADDYLDEFFLHRGLIHLSKENAIAHAKALIKLSGGKADE